MKPVSGLLVRIERLNSADGSHSFVQSGSADLSATTEDDGSFAFSDPVALDVDACQHFLYLSDSKGAYFDNDATVVYAMRDCALSYGNLKVAAKAPSTYTVVSCVVKDIISGSAVSGLSVTLANTGDSSKTYSATTGSNGSFIIEKVPVVFYFLSLDGSKLATPYIAESSDIALENKTATSLGDLLVSQKLDSEDLRIVLSWTNRSRNLDASFSLPKPNLDFNHLGTTQVALPSSGVSVNPAFHFAEGTA